MSIRKLGSRSSGEGRGGVRVAFVPVSVNISHPLDLAVCAVLALAWQAVSHLRAIKAGAAASALNIPGAVVVPAAGDGSRFLYLQAALDRLDALYLEQTGDLPRESFATAAERAAGLPVEGRVA